jgi:hypothetical protein
MKLYAQFDENKKLMPEFGSDYETAKKIRQGVTYSVELKQPRNYQFHKKFFALLNLCFENQETFSNIQDMRGWLIMRAGFFVKVETPTGQYYKPKSISFGNMDETEFSELYSKILDVVFGWLKIDSEQLETELINYM